MTLRKRYTTLLRTAARLGLAAALVLAAAAAAQDNLGRGRISGSVVD